MAEPSDRLDIEEIGEGFWRLVLNCGFMEEPDVPHVLASVRHPGLQALQGEVSYFLGRETLLATSAPGMARWRQTLFTLMSRNAQNAMTFFKLPPDRVVEVGVQVEL